MDDVIGEMGAVVALDECDRGILFDEMWGERNDTILKRFGDISILCFVESMCLVTKLEAIGSSWWRRHKTS